MTAGTSKTREMTDAVKFAYLKWSLQSQGAIFFSIQFERERKKNKKLWRETLFVAVKVQTKYTVQMCRFVIKLNYLNKHTTYKRKIIIDVIKLMEID